MHFNGQNRKKWRKRTPSIFWFYKNICPPTFSGGPLGWENDIFSKNRTSLIWLTLPPGSGMATDHRDMCLTLGPFFKQRIWLRIAVVPEAKKVYCKELANFKGNVQERTVRKTDGWEMSKAFLVASYLQFSFWSFHFTKCASFLYLITSIEDRMESGSEYLTNWLCVKEISTFYQSMIIFTLNGK